MSRLNLKPTPPPKPTAAFMEFRESVESLAVAVILAMLFRSFIAEAFVIPTGSMAPTLMGRHVDVTCPECEFAYQASASVERGREDELLDAKVVNARCPNCSYRQTLDIDRYFSNEHSFSGDRIIVSKYAYEINDPRRWDVIVFKYPENAQINFIKRLIGLPNETVRIEGGNIYVKPNGSSEFTIARKPPDKLLAMLQIVHDSDHPNPRLIKAGWPSRWLPITESNSWQALHEDREFHTSATAETNWIRYHHYEPSEDHWQSLNSGGVGDVGDWGGRLISDFYAYNCAQHDSRNEPTGRPTFGRSERSPAFGQYWVDDLAVECEATVAAGCGQLLLDLVRGGWHYRVEIATDTGIATARIVSTDGQEQLTFSEGQKELTGNTPVRGAGKHRLRLTNVDHELRLWVNDQLISFNAPATYDSPALIFPDIDDPVEGDVAPVGIGAKNCEVTLSHLKVFRDIYYVAMRHHSVTGETPEYYYLPLLENSPSIEHRITQILAYPEKNAKELQSLLKGRKAQEFKLEADQFMPLGDNSPASSDARYWEEPYVERYLLLGRAMAIYWPHSWNSPMFFPNFRRMKPIH